MNIPSFLSSFTNQPAQPSIAQYIPQQVHQYIPPDVLQLLSQPTQPNPYQPNPYPPQPYQPYPQQPYAPQPYAPQPQPWTTPQNIQGNIQNIIQGVQGLLQQFRR